VWGIEEKSLQRVAVERYGRKLSKKELSLVAQLLHEEFRASGLEESIEHLIAAVVEREHA
jgi:hypothetical protein